MNTSRIFSGSTVQCWCLSSVPSSDPVLSVILFVSHAPALKCIKTATSVLCNWQELEGFKTVSKKKDFHLEVRGPHLDTAKRSRVTAWQSSGAVLLSSTDSVRLTLPGVGRGSKGLRTLWRDLGQRRKGSCNLPTGVLCACLEWPEAVGLSLMKFGWELLSVLEQEALSAA